MSDALLPTERLILTVARAQIQRGENPPINTTTALVFTIERLSEALERCGKVLERHVTDPPDPVMAPATPNES